MDIEAQVRGQYDTICTFSGMAAAASFLGPASALAIGSSPVYGSSDTFSPVEQLLHRIRKWLATPVTFIPLCGRVRNGGRITNA